jgi:hypothetical protein
MSNIAKALKAEISRISRKEAKSATGPIAKSNIDLKKTVVDLKKRLAALEKENKRLLAGVKKEKPVSAPEPSEETKKARITSTTIRSLRSRLGLSQAEFGKLAGSDDWCRLLVGEQGRTIEPAGQNQGGASFNQRNGGEGGEGKIASISFPVSLTHHAPDRFIRV